MLEAVMAVVPVEKLSVHFHNTMDNFWQYFRLSPSIGGCPHAKGASGSVATKDVVYMLNGPGVKTNVDMGELLVAGEFTRERSGCRSESKASVALGPETIDTCK